MHTCIICQQKFEITPEEQKLYQKFEFEPTGECFECNQKKRLAFRNARKLYHRKCDLTGKPIISIYSPDKPYKVYSMEAWHGDSWDSTDYGREFDFSRPFFEQYKELMLEVPRLPLININAENSDFCNMSVGNKNCYLVFGGDFNEDTMYGTLCMHNKDCIDLDFSNHNELSYMLGDSVNCYDCQFVLDSKNCKNSYYLTDCIGCNDCILCSNLTNQSYCIENKQYSKEEYQSKRQELIQASHSSRQEMMNKFKELRKNRIARYSNIIASEDCTGDYIKDSKNCHNCFDTSNSEDLRNIIFASYGKDCFNTTLVGDKSELIYECFGTANANNIQLSYFCIDSSNIRYSDTIFGSHDSFGCTNMKQKRNCILNKQYSKEEYDGLIPKIIEHMKSTGEWGQFFPRNLSTFGYNESTAHEYFPMSKEEALRQGFNWSEAQEPSVTAEKKITANQLPDSLNDIPDDILNWAIECEKSGKLFKINQKELKFYRAHNIPVPHLHSEERYKLRQSFRNQRHLYDRQCSECGVELKTTYSPDQSEKIHCEDCYRKKVY